MTTQYLTVQEVADIFRKTPRTIYRWIEEGDPIKVFTRVRDGVLIPRQEVDRILSEGTNKDISDIVKSAAPQGVDAGAPQRIKSGFVSRWRK